MSYYNAEICKQGHIISSHGMKHEKYCQKCGSEIINKCPSCNHPIHGVKQDEWDYIFKMELPYYCKNCGTPYPWTSTAIETIQEVLLLDSSFNQEDVTFISNNASDLLAETPKTKLVATKMKIMLSKAALTTGNIAKDILVDVLSETAKKIILEGSEN